MTTIRDGGGRRPEEIYTDIVVLVTGPSPTTTEQWTAHDEQLSGLWNELYDGLGPDVPSWARLAVGLVADQLRRCAEHARIDAKLGR